MKRILIIHDEGNSFNNPTLKCIFDLLLENNCEIDLRYSSRYSRTISIKGIRYLPFGNTLRRFKAFAFNLSCFKPLIWLSVFIENLILYKKYDLIIGVDRIGLIESHLLHKLTGAPYIFISFEISFASETSLRFKFLEKHASRNVSLWIAQDPIRAQLLQTENNLEVSKLFLLPVASAGPGVFKTPRLRDLLGIPTEKYVAISIGSVATWTMTTELLRSAKDWPENWVLVVHERYGRTSEILKNEISDLKEHIGHKIFISDEATVAVDDMGSILAGMSVGFALYKPYTSSGIYGGKNIQFLGLSSGKISTYLRYGIPIIMNNIGAYSEESLQHQFGCVADQPENIIDCLKVATKNNYQRNAQNYYLNKLDFNVYRDRLWLRLQHIMH